MASWVSCNCCWIWSSPFDASGGNVATMELVSAKTPALKAEQTKTIRKFRRSVAFIALYGSLSRAPADVKFVAG